MARCEICDYCRETDGGSREVKYNRRFKQDLCGDCEKIIWQSTYGNENKFDYNPGAGEVPLLDLEDDYASELSVEGLDILEEFGVEGDP